MSIIVWALLLVFLQPVDGAPSGTTYKLNTFNTKEACQKERNRVGFDMASAYPHERDFVVVCRPRTETVLPGKDKRSNPKGLAVAAVVDPSHVTPEFLKGLAKHLSVWLRQHFPDPSKETELHVMHIQDMKEADPSIVIISVRIVKHDELLQQCYIFFKNNAIIGWVPAKTSVEPAYEEVPTKELQA